MNCLHVLKEMESWHGCKKENGEQDDVMAVISEVFCDEIEA